MGSMGETKPVTTASGATWQEVAAGMQKHRDSTLLAIRPPLPKDLNSRTIPLNVTGIPKQILTPKEVEITEAAVEVLVPLLAEGKLTAVEVANAFLRRAGVAQLLVRYSTSLSNLSSRRDLTNGRRIVLPNCCPNAHSLVQRFWTNISLKTKPR
jgi:hypothetical protein